MQIDDTKAAELKTFVENAQVVLTKKAAEEAQVSSLAEQTANHLISVGAVPAEKKASIIPMLNNPVQTLNLMTKLANLYKKAKEEVKEARSVVPADGRTTNFRDAGIPEGTPPMKESDKAYYRAMGVNV